MMHTEHWFCYTVAVLCSLIGYVKSWWDGNAIWIDPNHIANHVCSINTEKEEWIARNLTLEFVEWTEHYQCAGYTRVNILEYTRMLEFYLWLRRRIESIPDPFLEKYDLYLNSLRKSPIFSNTRKEHIKNILFSYSPTISHQQDFEDSYAHFATNRLAE